MYNKTKRGLDLAAAIIGICVGSIQCLAALILFFSSFGMCSCSGLIYEAVGDPVGGAIVGGLLSIVFIVAALILVGMGVALILVGVKLCAKPVLVNGVYDYHKGAGIALIVLFGLSVFSSLFLAVIAGLVLKIVGFCIKDNFIEQPEPQPTTARLNSNPAPVGDEYSSMNAKIDELKHLKDLGAISDEQFQVAVEKVIKDMVK